MAGSLLVTRKAPCHILNPARVNMSYIFLFLLLLSIAGLVLGLIKPSLVKVSSRKIVLTIFGGLTIFSFFAMAITVPPTQKNTAVEVLPQDTAKVSAPEKVAEQKPITASIVASSTQSTKAEAQKELSDFMKLSTNAHIVKSYDFTNERIVYVDTMWYEMTVIQKQDFVAHVAILKKAAAGYQHFEVHDAYSNEKVAEVTTFLGSVKVYK